MLPRPKTNPFTGEPITLPEARDWGDVHELVRKGRARELRKLFGEGMTLEEFRINYEARAEDQDYLHLAVQQGDLAMVKLLVEQGADAGELNSEYRITPLETAVQHKQYGIAEYLVGRTESQQARKVAWQFLSDRSRAKTVRPVDRQLFEAVQAGGTQRVATALREGANPDCVITDKRTRAEKSPLAAASFRADLPIVEALLEAGADINRALTRSAGMSPLCYAVESDQPHAPAVVRKLLEAGADPNHQPSDGKAPLHEACCVDRSRRIEERSGKDRAIEYLQGRVRIVEALLEHGARPQVRDKEGRQPIHWIQLSFSPAEGKDQRQIDAAASIVQQLASAGGDVHAESAGGDTMLMMTRDELYEDYKSALIDAGVLDLRSDELVQAAVRNDPRAVRRLLQAGVNVNHRGDAPSFAGEVRSLCLAIGEREFEQPFVPGQFARQVTPLHVAVGHRRLGLARLLLKAGANPDVRGLWLVRDPEDPRIWEPAPREDWYGYEHAERFHRFTPLTAAIEHSSLELVALLIEAGADLYLDAPLVLAIQHRATDIVKALLEAGVDPRRCTDGSLGRPRDALSVADDPALPAEIRRLVHDAARSTRK